MGLCLRRRRLQYPWQGWQGSTGISGSFQADSVATFDWNRWQGSTGISGNLRAEYATYGAVTLIVVSEPREEQFYVMCLATAISGPRLIRAWKLRHWIEYCFRTLQPLLATGACQVQNEDAYYGHLVLRLMGCLVLFYTSRWCAKGG